jgi:FixJ family two-component response regulator
LDARPARREDAAPLIVVVDDDTGMRQSLQFLLESLDYRVATFADGAAFMAAMAHLSPDCLILDVHLPGETGFDVLGRLAARRTPPPAIFVTGQLDAETERRAGAAQAVAVLEKPFADVDLIGALERAVGTR